jgi:DNA repair photolyase
MIGIIPAKTIITHTAHPETWFGNTYNMNIYRGCCHGCIYCDSRSACYHVENFDKIVAKENALTIIEKELKSKRKKGLVGTGAMSDPYNPQEGKYRFTEGALQLIDRYGFGVNVITKSDLVVRDIVLLKRINMHAPVGIGITITIADDNLAARIEPAAPASSRRFAAIRNLTEQGIYAGILMTPILPFISDNPENISAIIRLAAENGARFIYPAFGMTLREGQREYYYRAVERLYPGLSRKYIETFGNSYQCLSPSHQSLDKFFQRECEHLNIPYRMPDIIQGISNSAGGRQLGLGF